jgi:hypothetical protein
MNFFHNATGLFTGTYYSLIKKDVLRYLIKCPNLIAQTYFYVSHIKNKKFWEELIAYFPWHDRDRIEIDVSNNSSIVGCVFVTAVTFLPSRCVATIREFFY